MTDLTSTHNNTNPMRISLVQDKLKGKAFLIPNSITVFGTFCGVLSTISAFHGKFEYAAGCILLAVIVDFLDGRVARKLNATSEFGKQLDSLSDLVAFGVAPAILLYNWGFAPFADRFGILISYLFVACGAIRLARFNVTTSSMYKYFFQGLPIPGAAGVASTLCYAFPHQLQSPIIAYLVMILSVVLSLLMVSSVPYANGKNLKLKDVDLRLIFLVLSIAVALSWYNFEYTLLFAFLFYMAIGPVYLLYSKVTPPEKNTIA